MAICQCCGNNYDKSFNIFMNDHIYTFDCFECAIHLLAPECAHCEMKIIGHGVEANGSIYCCAHCAKHEGVTTLKDRAETQRATQ